MCALFSDSNGRVSTGSGIAVKCFDFAEYVWETDGEDVKLVIL